MTRRDRRGHPPGGWDGVPAAASAARIGSRAPTDIDPSGRDRMSTRLCVRDGGRRVETGQAGSFLGVRKLRKLRAIQANARVRAIGYHVWLRHAPNRSISRQNSIG